jgi:hypothetical protein
MYAYLIGTIGLGIVFLLIYALRKELRRLMVYSGLFYLVYGFIIFLFIKLLATDPARAINPGYWTPPSLFDLNSKTGGYGIEDALFSFFAGGIAACLYDVLFKIRAAKKADHKLKKGHALSLALLVSSVVFVLTPLNAIYFFIFLGFFGAAAIIWQRKDLLLNALAGGVIFMVLYGILFTVFNFLFPHFLADYYHLQMTSHIMVLGIPLEEYLYALSLGLMWAPIYEYEHRVKDRKRRSLKTRRLSLVAASAKR